MSSVGLVLFCIIYGGVNTFVTQTQHGVTVRLDMQTHVFEANQSDRFFFEVQSCQNTTINLKYKNGAFQIFLDSKTDSSNLDFCNQQYDGVFDDCGPKEIFSSPNFCSKSLTFWVQEMSHSFDFGSGCKVGVDPLHILFNNRERERGDLNIEVSSAGRAEWKFGRDTCVPTTTTTTTTTKVPSLKTTMTTTSPPPGHVHDKNQTRRDEVLCRSAGVSTTGCALPRAIMACLLLLVSYG